MPELSVVIVATDNEQRTVLQVLVDGTSVARTVAYVRQLSGGGLRSVSRGACRLQIPT